jgi:alanyl-tRNA synthetase
LRRAVLDGHQMGRREPFLYKLVPVVAQMMKRPYPELGETVDRVQGVIQKEEANFFATIDDGLDRIERIFREIQSASRTTVEGGEAAELYQTYGVPPELFEAMATERGLAFDWAGFKHAMAEHGEISGKIAVGVMGDRGPVDAIKRAVKRTEFLGYETTEATATIKGIIAEGELHNEWNKTDEVYPAVVVLDRSPFYGESGGQVGDTGLIEGDGFQFRVTDTQRDAEVILHHGNLVKGKMSTGARVTARVDARRRDGIRRAHSATHVLHYALRKHLGTHAQQQGSKVDDDWLRFDFSNQSPVDDQHLATIAADVQSRVAAAEPVCWETLPLAEARKQGAMMLFGEKYPDPVRMVSMGPSSRAFSRELCGGTHLANTRDIGPFEIITEEGVSAGTRRIVAITGEKAAQYAADVERALHQAAALLDVPPLDVADAVDRLLARQRNLKKQLAGAGGKADGDLPSEPRRAAASPKAALVLAARLLSTAPLDVPHRVEAIVEAVRQLESQLSARKAAGPLSADSLLEKAETIGDTVVVVAEIAAADPNVMRQLIDQVRQKRPSSAVLLACKADEDKVTLVAGISRDLQDRGAHAGKWVAPIAKTLGGGGGGRPDMAQAGGKDATKLPAALEEAKGLIRRMME